MPKTEARSPLVMATLACGLAAFGLAAFLNGLLDFDIISDSSWLQKTIIAFIFAYGAYRVPLGIFLHVGFFWTSFALVLGLFVSYLPKTTTENRGIAFTFLSWFFYMTPAIIYFKMCWHSTGWSERDVQSAEYFMYYPVFGSIVSAAHLLVFWIAAKNKGIKPWRKIPWWSIFLPTAAYLGAAAVTEPLCIFHNTFVH
jgi:hypothetical protein